MIFLPESCRLRLAILSHSSGPVFTALFRLLNQACTSGMLFVCFALLTFSSKLRELLVIVFEPLDYVVRRPLNQACISGMFIVCFALLTTFSKLLDLLVIVLEPLGFVVGPSKQHRMRIAAFQALQPYINSRPPHSFNQACTSVKFFVCFALFIPYSKLLEPTVTVSEPLGLGVSFSRVQWMCTRPTQAIQKSLSYKAKCTIWILLAYLGYIINQHPLWKPEARSLVFPESRLFL